MNFVYLLLFLPQLFVSSLYITIDSDKGNDTEQCLNGSESCRSLRHVANYTNGASNITIEIVSSSLLMQDSAVFFDIHGLSIIGQENVGTSISCGGNAAELVIHYCSWIYLEHFTLHGCGVKRKNRFIAFVIALSNHLTIFNVSVTHSTGIGMFIFNVSRTVYISNCTFLKNIFSGLRINMGNESKYIISYCHFIENMNCRKKYFGGGMQLTMANAERNNITISNCHFIKNKANFSSGLDIEVQKRSSYNKVTVSYCLFKDNVARKGGGGVGLGFETIKKHRYPQIPFDNDIVFIKSDFINNKASFAGGATIYIASVSLKTQKTKSWQINYIKFIECNFKGNIAYSGAAMHISLNFIRNFGTFLVGLVWIRDSNFSENSITSLNYSSKRSDIQNVTRNGILFIYKVWVYFEGENFFCSNGGTALEVSSSTIEFKLSANTTFYNNSGEKGGAILLVGQSQMFLNGNVNLRFQSNSASLLGGAIALLHLQVLNLGYSEECFMYKKFYGFVSFEFSNNQAKLGNDIFLPSWKACLYKCKSKTVTDMFASKCLGNFTFSNNSNSLASSTSSLQVTSPIHPIPGVLYQLDIIQTDEFRNDVHEIFPLFSTVSSKCSTVSISENIIARNSVKLYGTPSCNGTLYLSTNTVTNTDVKVAVSFEFAECSPGFVFIGNKCICPVLTNDQYYGQRYCRNITTITVGFWAGYLNKSNMNDDTFVTGHCSVAMCNFNNTLQKNGLHNLSSYPSQLEETVCGKTREGILCGQCKNNLSAYFHSPSLLCGKSDHCQYGIFLYIATELIPITILFLIVIILDIYLTSGTLYTIIFYAQILDNLFVDAFRIITFDNPIVSFLLTLFRGLYGLADFNVLYLDKLSFCIVQDASVLDLFLFKYLTTLYALLLILATILFLKLNSLYTCIKLCRRCGRRNIRGSVINGLTAFLVLCYSQCAYVTFEILLPAKLYGKGGHIMEKKVVLFNGNIDHMSKEHLMYVIPAIFCLLLIILPPPILLLSEPLLVKLSDKITIRRNFFTYYFFHVPRLKLKPFLDSFQGCFKDNCRCFAGLFFLYRVCIFLPLVITNNIALSYMAVSGILLLILIIHSLIRPFQVKWHNFLDLFLLSNLLCVNTLTVFNYYVSAWNSQSKSNIIPDMQLTLIAIPLFIVPVCYLGPSAFKKLLPYCKRNPVDCNQELNQSLPARLLDEDYGKSYETFML